MTFLRRLQKISWVRPFMSLSHLRSSAQPTHTTHPHLIKNGEITPGITRDEYILRQCRLVDKIKNQSPEIKDHAVILGANSKRFMIDKIPYRFRQDTDMLYMCGCLETDCIFLLHFDSTKDDHCALMFTPPCDASQAFWDGASTSVKDGPNVWPVSQSLPSSDFLPYLSSIMKKPQKLTVWLQDYSVDKEYNIVYDQFARLIESGVIPGVNLQSPKQLIHSLRLIKSDAEIRLMRDACRISSEAIKATMESCSNPASENTLAATVEYECRIRGAHHLAYPPVVGGGNRANTIHYITNNNIVQPGEMVLMDAGCEYQGYSGDVSRTWPINSKFNAAQRDVYEAVLEVQTSVIELCSQRPSLDYLYSFMCSKLGAALQELCILPRNLEGSQLSSAALGFCPHHISHYLGMDVHDTPLIPKSERIPVGSIITVEPGIYISSDKTNIDKRYAGIGVRIEDNILIKENDVEMLTDACPKEPDAIEAIIGKKIA